MVDLFAAVNAVSVVLLVGVTIWYARSTARMMEVMRRQSDLMAVSIEVQALLAGIQAEQTSGVGPEALKRIFALQHRADQLRLQIQASDSALPPTRS